MSTITIQPPTDPAVAKANARAALGTTLLPFIGRTQRRLLRTLIEGEEASFFIDKVNELHRIVTTMPKVYEQDGLGDEAIAYLRYFAGGAAACWITERDLSATQHQAFGLADLFGDGGELGYISLAEWLANGAEIDLHYTPQSLREIKESRRKA